MSAIVARPITGVPIGGTPMRGRALGAGESSAPNESDGILLMESDDSLLLESDDKLLLE